MKEQYRCRDQLYFFARVVQPSLRLRSEQKLSTSFAKNARREFYVHRRLRGVYQQWTSFYTYRRKVSSGIWVAAREVWGSRMTAVRTRSSASAFFLSSVDRQGRPIDPLVLAVAYEVGPRAVAYGNRLLVDSALSMDLFEDAAGSVTYALQHRPSHARPIRDLASYLYRAYLRKVGRIQKKQRKLRRALKNEARIESFTRKQLDAEMARLFDEIMARYGAVLQQMVYRHLEGFSWNEIGAEFGVDPHVAEMRYSRALAQARVLLGIHDS